MNKKMDKEKRSKLHTMPDVEDVKHKRRPKTGVVTVTVQYKPTIERFVVAVVVVVLVVNFRFDIS